MSLMFELGSFIFFMLVMFVICVGLMWLSGSGEQ